MLSEMCLENTARACGGSWPLTYSQHVFSNCVLDVSFDSDVVSNIMGHISLLNSRRLSHHRCAETGLLHEVQHN
jgi:hypothetical protein